MAAGYVGNVSADVSGSAQPGNAVQRYRMPRSVLMKVVYAAVRSRKRDVWTDCTTAHDKLRHQPVVRGIDHVPTDGPIVFLPNHYERKDAVWVGWGAIALTTALARNRDRARLRALHWVMTDTWADCFIGPFHLPPDWLGWVLKGFGNVYGITRMPAHDLPNHKAQRGRSAASLREVFGHIDRGECVALHPEAGGFETLVKPPAGAGRVLQCLERRGVTMVPVGIYEENDRLVVNIGTPIAPGSFRSKTDSEAAATAMQIIAALIPEANRGVFA